MTKIVMMAVMMTMIMAMMIFKFCLIAAVWFSRADHKGCTSVTNIVLRSKLCSM